MDFTHILWRTNGWKVTDEMVVHTSGWMAPRCRRQLHPCQRSRIWRAPSSVYGTQQRRSNGGGGQTKKTLRTTTKASRGWQEGLKNRDREAPGEDLFLWMDGDSASFRRGRRLGRCRAQIQPLWRARGLAAPKRDTLNHLLLLIPDAESLLEPG